MVKKLDSEGFGLMFWGWSLTFLSNTTANQFLLQTKNKYTLEHLFYPPAWQIEVTKIWLPKAAVWILDFLPCLEDIPPDIPLRYSSNILKE